MTLPLFRLESLLTPPSAVDIDRGVITGVSIITEGDCRGHKFTDLQLAVDSKTMDQIVSCSAKFQKGVKVKMSHDGKADAIVGSAKNFNRVGERVTADIHLLKHTKSRDYLLEIATELPDTFGLSVSFRGDPEVLNGKAYARCAVLNSADIVDSPAANPAGLFEVPVDTTTNSKMTDKEFTDFQTSITSEITSLKELIAKATATPPVTPPVTPPDSNLQAITTMLSEIKATVTAQGDTIKLLGATPSTALGTPAVQASVDFFGLVELEVAKGTSRTNATQLCIKQAPEAYAAYLTKIGVNK